MTSKSNTYIVRIQDRETRYIIYTSLTSHYVNLGACEFYVIFFKYENKTQIKLYIFGNIKCGMKI